MTELLKKKITKFLITSKSSMSSVPNRKVPQAFETSINISTSNKEDEELKKKMWSCHKFMGEVELTWITSEFFVLME